MGAIGRGDHFADHFAIDANRKKKASFAGGGVVAYWAHRSRIALSALALTAAVPAGVVPAASQSRSSFPEETQDVVTAPASILSLPELLTRSVTPHQTHAPDETEILVPRPVELDQTVRRVMPKPVMKRSAPSEEVPLPQATVAAAPSPPVSPAPTAAAALPPAPPADKRESESQPGEPMPASSLALAPNAPAPQPPSDLVVMLLQRGDELLKERDIAAARLLYERAAMSGNARAAMLAGKTYDPLYFDEIGVRGIVADRAKAMEWYSAAAALGDREAATRTEKLRSLSQQ
jgi:hypothetical protein